MESSYRAGFRFPPTTPLRFVLGLLHFRFEDIAVQHAQHVKGAAQLCRETNKKQSHGNGAIGTVDGRNPAPPGMVKIL